MAQLDAFINIIEKNELLPDDIESVTVIRASLCGQCGPL